MPIAFIYAYCNYGCKRRNFALGTNNALEDHPISLQSELRFVIWFSTSPTFILEFYQLIFYLTIDSEQ